jgi:tRNA pseudouridine55 synthase
MESQDINNLNIEEAEITEILQTFMGEQKQIPPMYSAIKINGKKMYEYARKGEKVEVQERDIEISDIKLLEHKKGEITFEVACSKGTYIRTLCEDIAVKIGTVGYMKELRRTFVGTSFDSNHQFRIEKAIGIEKIKDNKNLVYENIINIEKIFSENKSIILDNRKLELFLNGVMTSMEKQEGLYKVYCNNEFIGLGIVKNKLLKRDVII